MYYINYYGVSGVTVSEARKTKKQAETIFDELCECMTIGDSVSLYDDMYTELKGAYITAKNDLQVIIR